MNSQISNIVKHNRVVGVIILQQMTRVRVKPVLL